VSGHAHVGVVAEPLPRFMAVLLSLDHAVWRNGQLGLCVCVIVEEPTCSGLHNWTESSTVLSCDGLIVRRFPWASISTCRHRDSVVYFAHGHDQRNAGMDQLDRPASEPGLSITRFTIIHSMVPLHSPGVDKLQAGRASQGSGRMTSTVADKRQDPWIRFFLPAIKLLTTEIGCLSLSPIGKPR